MEPDQHLLATTCRRRGRRRSRRSPTRCPTRSPCSTRCASASTRSSWARSSGASRSSSTPACGSSRSTRSCARWAQLWEEIGRERYGVEDPKHLRFRYGVQVNSLGLTEQQPENNVQRIVLEALAVTLGRNARARAIQLPAWNEALGLPRPWDQQWSLRIQQVLAFETDLLEYPDIFEGSKVMEGSSPSSSRAPAPRWRVVAEHGGAVEAVLVHEGRARRLAPRAHPPHRGGRADRRRPEQVHRDRAVAADRRRRGRHPRRRPGGRGRAARGRRASGARRATRPRSSARWTSCAASPRRRREHHARDDRGRPRRRDDRRVGAGAARRRSAPTARRPASARPPARPAGDELEAIREEVERVSRGARPAAEDPRRQARASTGTPTAPSRSPCARATPAWTSSTRASG